VVSASGQELLDTKWPREAAGITKDWLSALSGAKVIGYEITILSMGVLSDACILDLRFEGDTKGKMDTLVLKYAKGLSESRTAAVATNVYGVECNFFTSDIGPKSGLKIPECFGVWTDPENRGDQGNLQWFCIAMENLSVHNEPCDQIIGISAEEQYELCEVVGAFNASFYGSDVLKEDWIAAANGVPYKPWFYDWWETFLSTGPEGFRTFAKNINTHPDKEISVSDNDNPLMLEIIDIMLSEKGPKLMAKQMDLWGSRPFTLTHGDLRSDNIFRSKTPGLPLTFIDWQTLKAGPIGVELGQMMSCSMTNLEDYTQEPKMIAEYYSLMPDDMKDKYTVEEVQGDFVMTVIMIFFGAGTAFGGLFAEMPHDDGLWSLFEIWPLRLAATMQACDALSVLKNLAKLVEDEETLASFNAGRAAVVAESGAASPVV